jgi:polyisoprenoid-binding protein YceI
MNNNTNWSIDNAHSEIAFKVKHMMISTVTGYFEDFQATAKTDGENFNNASIEFSAKQHR